MSLGDRNQPDDAPFFTQLPLLTREETLILGAAVHEKLERFEARDDLDAIEKHEARVLASLLTAIREAALAPAIIEDTSVPPDVLSGLRSELRRMLLDQPDGPVE